MPDRVEKACAAYWECYREAWRPLGLLSSEQDVPFADLPPNTKQLTAKAMKAALAAAEAETQPVGWEYFRDESYFDLWCVRPKGERAFGVGFHVSSEAEAIALVETLAGKASPRPEAGGEDWRAVDDAIWFYLGHENHKPEDSARLRRMSGVVLGLAGEENKG